MTAFGKILVFMNLLFSVVTGALIVFVFTTRASWKTAYDNAAQQAEAAATAYKNEKIAHENDLKQRETAASGLGREVERLTAELAQARQDAAKAKADFDSMKKNADTGVNNATALQTEIAQLKIERKQFEDEQKAVRKKIVDLQDELDSQRRLTVQADLTAKTLLQKNQLLLTQVENLTVKLREAESGGLGESIVNPSPKAAPPGVRGKVTFVGTTGTAQVSVGSDSGLVVGNVLIVYRDNLYVGDLRLTSLESKIAVGQFTPAKRDLKITVGDNVITSFAAVDSK